MKFFTSSSDVVGIIGSSMCLIHCLATPLLVVLQWYESIHLFESPWWDYSFLLICLVAVFQTTRTHCSTKMAWLFWIAFGTFAGAILLEDSFPVARTLGYIASTVLIFAHLIKFKSDKKYHKKTSRNRT